MNPLTAIRSYLGPGPLGAAAAQALPLPGGLPAIPPSELKPVPPSPGLGAVGDGKPANFSNLLGQLVADVNERQLQAGQSVQGLLAGENVNLHQTMIALEEASVSFQLMVEVRNKLLESYQELMRMQI